MRGAIAIQSDQMVATISLGASSVCPFPVSSHVERLPVGASVGTP